MGKALTFRGTVYEARQLMKTHRCKDPICDTHLWRVKHELDMAKVKLKRLESELLRRGISPITLEDVVDTHQQQEEQQQQVKK